MNFHIKPDGSYDIATNSFSLQGCYPAIDGEKICAMGGEIVSIQEGKRIEYSLSENRKIALQLIGFGGFADRM